MKNSYGYPRVPRVFQNRKSSVRKTPKMSRFETAETQWFVFSLHFLVLRKLSYRVAKAIIRACEYGVIAPRKGCNGRRVGVFSRKNGKSHAPR
jgi:hypothetical protein